MRHTILHTRVLVPGLLACLALGTGVTWALWPDRAAGPDREASAQEILANLPTPQAASLVDKAIQHWTARVTKNERDDGAWAELGDALMQKARETVDSSWYAHAERAYRKGLAINPNCMAATTGVAWVHGCRHEFEESVAWAHKALRLDRLNHAAHGLLGDAAVETGDYDTAFEHYQKMLDLKPDLSSYSRGAHVLFLTGDLRKAAFLMNKAIQAGAPYAENTAWCQAQLALIYFANGNVQAAEDVLKDALEKAPRNLHVLAALGKVKAARKDYTGAMDCYRKAADIAPQHDVLVALGELYRLQGKLDEAAKQDELVETIHKLHKANGVRGNGQLARFYADRGRNLDEAVRMAEDEYAKLKNVFAADTLAWCYYQAGRYEDAARTIARALKRRTPDAMIAYHAGLIHAKLNDPAKARLYLAQALSLNPHFSPVHAPAAAEALRELGSRPSEVGAAEEPALAPGPGE